MPHKQTAACTASAQNKACRCLFTQKPAQAKQRTVNVRFKQFAKTLNPQPQNKLQLRLRDNRSIIFYNLEQT